MDRMGKFREIQPEDAILWQFLILPKLRYQLIAPELFVSSAARAAAPWMRKSSEAYKDVSNVVDACALAGRHLAKGRPTPPDRLHQGVTNFRLRLHDGTTGVKRPV
jgi:hypothetical protein